MPSVILALPGLLVGALLNALADGLPERRTPSWPLRCAHCGRAHPPHYWLAVSAFFFAGGGRCLRCGSPMGLRRVVVELASAVALGYLWSRFGPSAGRFLYAAAIVETLLLVTVIDIEHRLILRVVVYPAALVALAGGILDPDPAKGAARTLIGGAVGFGVTYLFYVFGRLFVKAARTFGRGQTLNEVAFGWGDVTLGAFIGLAVGWSSVLLALLIAVFAGGLGGAIYLAVLRARRVGRGTYPYSLFTPMPYGPYLALGGLVMLLWAKEFVEWFMLR